MAEHTPENPAPALAEKEDSSTQLVDGGYGWVCVAACFTINCFTWGLASIYGVYLAYYLRISHFSGATAFDFALVGGMNYAVASLVAPLVTVLARKYGTRPPMFFGALCLGGGFVAASFAVKAWQLYLSQGALVGIGIGFAYVPSIAIISQWFSKRRSLANGIVSAGSGVGGVIFSLATGKMIESISLEWCLRITGIIAFAMLVVAIALTRDRNHIIKPKQHPFDVRLLVRYDVWLLLVWAFLSTLGQITLLNSLPDFALSIGLTQSQSTEVITFVTLGTALGRPCIGFLSDYFGRIKVAALLTLICGVAVFGIWIPAKSFAVTVLFALISGGILGVFWATISPLCAELVGLKQLQSLLSISWLMIVLPALFSEPIALFLRRPDSDREYLYPQIFGGVSYLVASAFLFALHVKHTRSKKITQNKA